MTFDELNARLTPHGPILSIMSDAERRGIWEIMAQFPGEDALEIGACQGGTTAVLAFAGARKVAVIDAWFDSGNYDMFCANMATLNLDDRIKIIRVDSRNAWDLVPDNHFAVVLVDADHEGDAPLSDLRLYAPKVKVGGYLLVDDVGNGHKDVTEAVATWQDEVGDAFVLEKAYPVEPPMTGTKLHVFRRYR